MNQCLKISKTGPKYTPDYLNVYNSTSLQDNYMSMQCFWVFPTTVKEFDTSSYYHYRHSTK
jgi:hypothetical protein